MDHFYPAATPRAERFVNAADAAVTAASYGAPLAAIGNVIVAVHPPKEVAALGWALLIAPAIVALFCLAALLCTRYQLSQGSGPQGHPNLENIEQAHAPNAAAAMVTLQNRMRLTAPLVVFLALIVCSPALPSLTSNMPF